MPIPTKLHEHAPCRYWVDTRATDYNPSDYIIPSLGIRDGQFPDHKRGYIAARKGDVWAVKEALIPTRDSSLNLVCVDRASHDEMAYPIDPRMAREDIEGASILEPNATNTGWLFYKTRKGTHHDYELTLLAHIGAMFGLIIGQFRVDQIRATDDQSRSDAALKEVTATLFWADVKFQATQIVRSLYLGQRVVEPHPDTGYLDADSTKAVEAVKAKWKQSNPNDLDDLTSAFQFINRYLNMPPVETPWDYRARISNANLRALSAESRGQGSAFAFLDIGTFSPDTFSYAASVSAGTTELRLAATPEAEGAKVVIPAPISLATGRNVITVSVTALDGETIRAYTVVITRASE